MIAPFFQGLGTGGGLIVAIGAQNAFVLSQGVRKNHHLTVALVCIACDAVFIAAGVGGVGTMVSAVPFLSRWMIWGGAGFLFFYGLGSLRSALQGGSMEVDGPGVKSLRTSVLATLAVSLLNPHFYLDNVVLMGGLSSQFQGEDRLFFCAGAVSASILWFMGLSLGGQILAPLFRKPMAWRFLDSLVCLTMWTIALSLIVGDVSD